ncbi:hypothetical protein ACWDKQ_35245 [Saccharopolyspora sp. NPDC000995]
MWTIPGVEDLDHPGLVSIGFTYTSSTPRARVRSSSGFQGCPVGFAPQHCGLLGVLVTSGTPIAQAMAIVLVYRAINWVGLAVLDWFVYAIQIHVSPQSG